MVPTEVLFPRSRRQPHLLRVAHAQITWIIKESHHVFHTDEVEYLTAQPLARLATVDTNGKPDVVPVAFEFDGSDFWIGGSGQSVLATRKFRNILDGHHDVALVVDDMVSFNPFIARGIRVYGHASEPIQRTGLVGPGVYVAIRPTISWSWNMASEPVGANWYTSRRQIHTSSGRTTPD